LYGKSSGEPIDQLEIDTMAAIHQAQRLRSPFETPASADAIVRQSQPTIKGTTSSGCQPKNSASPEIKEQSLRGHEQNKTTSGG
jgi:hypothetical protein